MSDTLDRLHAVVEGGLGSAPPLEELRRRVRRSALTRRAPVMAALAASVVAAVVIAVGHRPTNSRVVPSALTHAVTEGVTPKGWSPVAWRNAEVSVPDGWQVPLGQSFSCGTPADRLWLNPGLSMAGCPNVVDKAPYAILRPLLPGTYPKEHWEIVNGMTVYSNTRIRDGQRTLYEYVPSLGVELQMAKAPGTTAGAVESRILGSLSYSPRIVALEKGPVPEVPDGWRRLSFEGLTLEVPPRDGKPMTYSRYPAQACGPYPTMGDWVNFDTDTKYFGGAPSCVPGGWSAGAWSRAGSGVEVDAVPGRVALGTRFPVLGACSTIHGLRVCPYTAPAYDVLDVRVSGGHLPHAFLVQIGLAGTGMTARTILHSLRKA